MGIRWQGWWGKRVCDAWYVSSSYFSFWGPFYVYLVYIQQWVWMTECECGECEWGKVSMSGRQDNWVWVCVVEYEWVCMVEYECEDVERVWQCREWGFLGWDLSHVIMTVGIPHLYETIPIECQRKGLSQLAHGLLAVWAWVWVPTCVGYSKCSILLSCVSTAGTMS